MAISKTALLAVVLLAACSGNPIDNGGTGGGGGGGGETDLPIPESLARNVTAAAYDADKETLQLQISGLDTTPITAVYSRIPKLDLPGYQAFKVQEDALDRMFIALAAESQDGSVRAVTAGDGGQFNKYFGGGYYERDGGFDRPTIGTGPAAGQVSYAGDYAGLTNIGVPGNPDAIPVPPGTDPAVIPRQPVRVEGDIFLNVNFAENLVNGSVYNRVLVEGGFQLTDIVLLPTDIAADGTFLGTVEGRIPNETEVDGTFGGVFGGTDSAAVAGVVSLTKFEDDFDNEEEHGVFVLTQCGLAGDAAICDDVAPN
jgi:hypothetical protein